MSGKGHSCPEQRREIERLEREIRELKGVIVAYELDFELDRYQFEALIEWALDADAKPEDVDRHLRPNVQILLWQVARDYGWYRPPPRFLFP